MTSSFGKLRSGDLVISMALRQLADDESGQDMIEYALIAASLGLASVAGVNGLASHISNYMNIVGAGFDAAV